MIFEVPKIDDLVKSIESSKVRIKNYDQNSAFRNLNSAKEL